MRVLVVEDEQEVRDLVRWVLERDGHEVTGAADGTAALTAAASQAFDIVILDVGLSGMSGFDVLHELRSSQPDPHVIMLTGAGGEAERLRGFASGADDYVMKPFSPRELCARLDAVARRRAGRAQTALEAEDLLIDLAARQVVVRGVAVELSRLEVDLIVHLVSNPRRTFSRRELLEAVWHSTPEWQSQATVTEHVSRLRSKIERDPAKPERIVTVRGAGYRFEPGVIGTHVELRPTEAEPADNPRFVIVDSTVVYANGAAAVLLGVAGPEDLVGHHVLEFVAPVSLAVAGDRRGGIDAGAWPRPQMMTLLRSDGGEVLVELASRPVTWNASPATHVNLIDMAAHN